MWNNTNQTSVVPGTSLWYFFVEKEKKNRHWRRLFRAKMTLSLSTSLLISAPYESSLFHSPWVRIMCQPQANPRLSLYTYLALSRNQGPFWYQPLEYIQLNFPRLYASRSGVYQVSLDAMLALWYIEPRGSRAEMVSGWKWEREREWYTGSELAPDPPKSRFEIG